MEVGDLYFFRFLEGMSKNFIIPVYQRDYAWTKSNCKKLWDDLEDLNSNKRRDHFLGTLVTVGGNMDTYTVIDGQQRLTTVSILLIALHNFLKEVEKRNDEERILSEQILGFLVDQYSPKDKRIKLKPNKQDKEYFESLFTKSNNRNVNSNIINNYNFFYEQIEKRNLSPEEIFKAFKKLKIVSISLTRGVDDPQLIFESLNSTGVDLTAGDLIRNYILMDMEFKEQEKMYNDYWVNIEKLTSDIAEFVRNYLIFKNKVSVKRDDVYTEFKKFSVDNFNSDKELILQDLFYFAEIYSWLVQINKYSLNNSVNKKLYRLKQLEVTVSYPYLLDVFNDLRKNILTEEIVISILSIIESYTFRKILVDYTTQGLNKMFLTLAREIKKEKTWREEYLNILSFIILGKERSQKCPTDEEFENSLITKEIYKLQAKNKNFLLESLENFNTAYTINIDELTIEHIMPQNLTEEWKSRLGNDWQEVHGKYLHTLGNLSLTANNTKLSNNSIEDKQKIDFQTSKLKLNFKLDNITSWNEKQIIERAKDLAKDAKNVWQYPNTSYSKSNFEEQIFDLTSEDDFSGTKPTTLYIDNDEKGVDLKTWRDLLIYICKFLYDFSPTQFLYAQNSQELKQYFGDKKTLRDPLEFMPDKFVEGNNSANSVISILSKLCEKLNYPLEKISFAIKNTKE